MSVPNALFYALLRARWDESAWSEAAQIIQEGSIDWPAFLHLAKARGLAPLIYSVTRDHALLPPQVDRALQAHYVHNAARSTLLFDTLHAILDAFEREGVQVILLKGAALAESVYANPALRPMMDLDLLIRRDSLDAATRALTDLGFAPDRREPRRGAMQAFESQMRFHRPDLTDSLVELHWSLLDSPYYQERLNEAWFWQSARPVRDSHAHTLGPEAQIIHLSAHMLLHHGRTIWLGMHDIAEVCYHEKDTLDWALLLAKARAMHLVLPLQHILPQVKRGWRASIPDAVLQDLQRLPASDDERRAFHWLTRQRTSEAHHFLADLLTTPSARQRWRFALANIFPSPVYVRERYGMKTPWLTPYAYLRRWLRGMAHLRHLLRPPQPFRE